MEEEVFDEVGPHFRGARIILSLRRGRPESLSEERSNSMRGGVYNI